MVASACPVEHEPFQPTPLDPAGKSRKRCVSDGAPANAALP